MSKNVPNSPGPTCVDWNSGEISGAGIEESVKVLGQMAGLFHDEAAWHSMDLETVIYRVRFWRPVPDGTSGGLFWGSTVLEPGRVGDEYFMTHGHFHAVRDRAEFYATVKGTGAMLFMGENRETWSQCMAQGSVHYIPGCAAHRVVNTGSTPLVFLACWPSDAGHDYARVRADGFSKRMVMRDGVPCLI
ncbi:MAG TPA: glucose-6-phosphate isomerase family protein [Terracidiphilus sp.]|nr:glucose-6-phosphate isomerase family protein [Terracidiphilus sp.]